MHDWRVLMAVGIVLYILVAYCMEVVLGSCSTVYHAELGMDAACERMTRLSTREFFRSLPALLGGVGLLFVVVRLGCN